LILAGIFVSPYKFISTYKFFLIRPLKLKQS